MRKEESEFKTCFISEAGTIKTNKDYFAFTELDDYACWVIASGVDSEEEKESAKIAVESILSDFMDNPSVSRRSIKKYLYNANRVLKSESLNISLNASVTVVVSDYSKLVWAVCGNTRLYQLRAGNLNFKSRDQSLSQVMADKGKIDTMELNSHEEANNLTCCLGMSGMFRPFISKKFELVEGDAILLCTGGFIRGIDDIEITDALQETKEP
ncbi:MAG TPA: serine/threonine protein phosphatase, partial [Clostridia bacterium]